MYSSSLFNQDNFYRAFIKDLYNARSIVIIESPFITQKRMNQLMPVFRKMRSRGVRIIVNTKSFNELMPVFRKMRSRGVRIIVNTKSFNEHDSVFYDQVIFAVGEMQTIGIEVFMTVGHHRKLAVIDSGILWEGSLNILSQNDSCEIMRRIYDDSLVNELLSFINF